MLAKVHLEIGLLAEELRCLLCAPGKCPDFVPSLRINAMLCLRNVPRTLNDNGVWLAGPLQTSSSLAVTSCPTPPVAPATSTVSPSDCTHGNVSSGNFRSNHI